MALVVPRQAPVDEGTVAREVVRALKDKLLQRCVARRTASGGTGYKERQLIYDDFKESSERTLMPKDAELQKVVAGALLEIVLPIETHTLHRELSKSKHGSNYKRANSEGPVGLDKLVVRMSLPASGRLLQLDVFDLNLKRCIFIVGLDRPHLASIAGVPDPWKPPLVGTPLAPSGLPPAPPMPGAPGVVMRPPFVGGPMRPAVAAPPPPGMGMRPPAPPPPGHPGLPPAGMMLPGMPPYGQAPNRPFMPEPEMPFAKRQRVGGAGGNSSGADPLLDGILQHKSVKDRYKSEKGEALLDLLQKPTAKENATLEKFRSAGGPVIREHCELLTKDECRRGRRSATACAKLHFRKIIHPWTDVSLGNCSYLDTCRNVRSCKYIHYELDPEPDAYTQMHVAAASKPLPQVPAYLQALSEPQWINCDVRTFDMTVLGKFGVIMADPPWEIHQELPYGTMSDDEMRNMNITTLQDDGVIFLWVTGRAMELGRECLKIWGYSRVDELIWVKTNQLQRLVRTGRTGHWINHSKEHCLVGIKGSPQLNRYVDCDVVMAEVRETSRKPDEMYPLLERLSPGTRKLEIFARPHNLQPGWVGLGNQLGASCIKDPDMRARYEKVYGPLLDEGAMKPQQR